MSLINSDAAILVVEDNPGDYLLIQDHLLDKIPGVQITHGTNFRQAKDALLTETAFDVILLDLSLPDKTGEDLIRGIMELSRMTPVIVLTGYSEFAFGVKSLSLGVSDYLLKDEISSSGLYKSIVYSFERKRITVALEESEKKYSEMFHLSPLPMWVMEPDSFHFLDVNKAAVCHYGYSSDEFLSMCMQDLMPPEDQIDANPDETGQDIAVRRSYLGITRHVKKDGSIIKVDTQSNVIKYRGNSAWMILANDVTERYNYIKAIEEQNERLRKIAWMQSHVVRAPLARIMGLIGLLKEAAITEQEKNEMMAHILDSANELDQVIQDISEKTRSVQY